MKIGQEVEIKEGFDIKTILSNETIMVKENDKGFVDSQGLIHLTTGNGRGKIVKIDDIEVSEYGHRNIAKMIFNRLNCVFGIEEFIYSEDVKLEDFINEIEDVLMDIL